MTKVYVAGWKAVAEEAYRGEQKVKNATNSCLVLETFLTFSSLPIFSDKRYQMGYLALAGF